MVLLAVAGPAELSGLQNAAAYEVTLADGSLVSLPLDRDRGYAAVPLDALGLLGWVQGDSPGGEAGLAHVGGATLHLWSGSPIVLLNDQLLQMADPAYSTAGALHVPLQLVTDLIPAFGPGGYTTEDRLAAETMSGAVSPDPAAVGDITAATDVVPGAGAPDSASVAADIGGADTDVPADSTLAVALVAQRTPPQPGTYDRVQGGDRLVVIDAGHGGGDVGAVGPGGVTEKSVALSVALALARELASRPGLDVRVTRDRDIEVPAEYRGDWATEWMGDRPGIFLSIHANTLPERTGVRGFETYSLGCAGTEQERRVSAVESGRAYVAPDPANPDFGPACTGTELSTGERSADLAFRVQEELGSFHPGPDRGVRQGYFDVLASARMPGVLIELGFLTNPEEERALARPDFHRQAAAAIARAIDAHFEAAPPGGLP
ncbi:MAG TPA: N-acetylmuramoyl-L-alanine amidase [Vicinamibacteria bacterium]